tara:strand:+ start:97 stop:462 length:366 start_codon:yes stop_codon:yes gene_type:complete
MEEGKITILVPEEKTFKVDRKTFKGTKYQGNINDCSLLASWYYNNVNIYAKNLIINIYGDYHTTFPNPPHLTVEFVDGTNNTGRLHMSWNGNQFYQQVLPFGRKKKKSKKIKKKLKSKSKK